METATAAPAAAPAAPESTDQKQQTGAPVTGATAEAPKGGETTTEAAKKRMLAWQDGDSKGEYDLDNPEHLERVRRAVQIARASERRMMESAKMRQEAEQRLSMLRDPEKVMEYWREQGIDPDQIATERLYRKIQAEAMTPEQREIERLRSEARTLQEKQQAEQMAREQAEVEQYEKQEMIRLDSELTKALQEHKLPKSRYLIGLAAHKLRVANQAGVDLPVSDAVAEAKAEATDHLKELITQLPEETVLSLLGEEFGLKISKYLTNRVRGQRTPGAPSQPSAPRQSPRQSDEKLSPHEWRERLRSQFAGT